MAENNFSVIIHPHDNASNIFFMPWIAFFWKIISKKWQIHSCRYEKYYAIIIFSCQQIHISTLCIFILSNSINNAANISNFYWIEERKDICVGKDKGTL